MQLDGDPGILVLQVLMALALLAAVLALDSSWVVHLGFRSG